MMCLAMSNLLDIFKKEKKTKAKVVNVKNPLTDHIKNKIGKYFYDPFDGKIKILK